MTIDPEALRKALGGRRARSARAPTAAPNASTPCQPVAPHPSALPPPAPRPADVADAQWLFIPGLTPIDAPVEVPAPSASTTPLLSAPVVDAPRLAPVASSVVLPVVTAPMPSREPALRQRAIWRPMLSRHIPRTLAIGLLATAFVVAGALVGWALMARPSYWVHFTLRAPSATTVTVIGDFNRWDSTATPMRRRSRSSTWETWVQLRPGRYEYLFLQNGTLQRTDADLAEMTSLTYAVPIPRSVLVVPADPTAPPARDGLDTVVPAR